MANDGVGPSAAAPGPVTGRRPPCASPPVGRKNSLAASSVATGPPGSPAAVVAEPAGKRTSATERTPRGASPIRSGWKNCSRRRNRVFPQGPRLPIPPIGNGTRGNIRRPARSLQHLEHAPREGDRMAPKKTARPSAALRITLPDGSSVVGSQASLAKILELTLFRSGHSGPRQPVRVAAPSRRAA
ncbi:MAG: hypothetical protein RLZZ326_2301 [Planctomycetota bacterium]|jgi:hypothetical protein